MNKEQLLKDALEYPYTEYHKELFDKMKNYQYRDIQWLRDTIWELPEELQTSLLREVARSKGIL